MKGRSEPQIELPARLGRYIPVSRLTEGGMTEVYAAKLAEEVGPGRMLVIKVLPKTAVDDPEAESRFLAEAGIILNLTHGNITAAFEFARDQTGRPFLVMEYVPGPSLRRLGTAADKQQKRIDIPDALFIVAEVLKALSYAHSFSAGKSGAGGIIHRDISPDNIVISTSGQVKLTDFGIAAFTQSVSTGPIFGKPAYIAPETAAGETPSAASDLYSTGAVLYECLTGVPPFKGDTDKETLAMAASENPKPPSALRSGISEALDTLVLSLLEKNPRNRPDSASAVEVRLRAILRQSCPEYTEFHLAKTVETYFDPKSFNLLDSKEGLRASMLAAGMPLTGLETTDDLLRGGTVPLLAINRQKGDAQPQRPSATARRIIATSALATAAVVVGFFLFRMEPTQTQNLKAKLDPVPQTPLPAHPQTAAINAEAATDTNEPKGSDSTSTDAPRDRETKTFKTTPKHHPEGFKAILVPKPQKKSPLTAGEWGWLNINSYPWSYVTVDGKKLDGHTPYRKIKLVAGPHTLIFENPELELKAVQTVSVSAWEETNIGVRLK